MSTNIYPNIVHEKILYLHYLFILQTIKTNERNASHHLQSVYYMIYNYCDNEVENIKYISPLFHTFPSFLITACNIHAIFTYIHPGNSSQPSQHRWQNPHMLASQKKKKNLPRIVSQTTHSPFFYITNVVFPWTLQAKEPSRFVGSREFMLFLDEKLRKNKKKKGFVLDVEAEECKG